MMKQRFVAGLAFLFIMAAETGGAQTLPPVTTEWKSDLILQNGALPPASYKRAVSVDSDADRTLVAVWNQQVDGPGDTFHYIGRFSRSVNNGRTWSEPEELLPNPDATEPLWSEVQAVAAGENGMWMAAVQLRGDSQDTTSGCGILTSMDSGRTWSSFQDLGEELQLQGTSARLDVAYCGNSTWILLYTSMDGIRYIRSTDNGKTWGAVVQLSINVTITGHVQGHPKGNAVMITYFDDDYEDNSNYLISRFSVDHGATFGPPILASTGATDGAGNWIVSYLNAAPNPLPLLHSSDNGQTFAPIPSPPVVDDRSIKPHRLAYSEAGEIVVIAYAVDCPKYLFTCFNYQSGLITRTSDLGQSWTPWERFGPNDAHSVISLDVTATPDNNFFAIMNPAPEAPVPLLNSYRLDLEPHDQSAAAPDWQIYW